METYNRLYDNFPVWFGWKGMTGLEPMGETEMGWGRVGGEKKGVVHRTTPRDFIPKD